MNKREFQVQALLRSIDNVHPPSQVVRAAGELYDEFLGEEPDKQSPAQPPSEWIRFVDRQPTEEDCLDLPSGKQICFWELGNYPIHITIGCVSDSDRVDTNCYWRPIPKLPEER